MARMTQTEMVLAMLLEGPLTSAQAFTEIGCVHLPRRIKDLRDAGYEIVSEVIKTTNRFGYPTHFNRYHLKSPAKSPTTTSATPALSV